MMQGWVITVLRGFQGFIYGDPNLFFNDNSQITETVGDVFLAFALTIGDAMIVSRLFIRTASARLTHLEIYRLWVVWSFNKVVIIVPILSLLGFISRCNSAGYLHATNERCPVSFAITIQATIHLESIALDTGLTPITVFTLV
jgi:hypothetical protein